MLSYHGYIILTGVEGCGRSSVYMYGHVGITHWIIIDITKLSKVKCQIYKLWWHTCTCMYMYTAKVYLNSKTISFKLNKVATVDTISIKSSWFWKLASMLIIRQFFLHGPAEFFSFFCFWDDHHWLYLLIYHVNAFYPENVRRIAKYSRYYKIKALVLYSI